MNDQQSKNPKSRATVTINGTTYDIRTGLPVTARPAVMAKRAQPESPKSRSYGSFDVKPAATVHAGPARSTALRRSGLAKPLPPKPLASRHVRTINPVPTHPMVSRFAPPATTRPSERHDVRPSDVLSAINADDARAVPTGLAVQMQNYTPASSLNAPHTAHAAAKKTAHQAKPTAARTKRDPRVESRWRSIRKRIRPTAPVIATLSVIVLLVALAVLYITVPALSLFVAAKGAGVSASYPNYVPSEYHFKGPVTYGDGSVNTRFVSSTGLTSFTITQKNTTWDSEAVLDNYVLARSAGYLTYSQSGITVYTFGSRAAWVTAGVLHTIDGDAGLTSDQVLRIAGSM